MDYNIREAIELVLEVKIEDAEDLSNLTPGEPALGPDPNVRHRVTDVPLPQPSSVQ
jgi:hypothetical protein